MRWHLFNVFHILICDKTRVDIGVVVYPYRITQGSSHLLVSVDQAFSICLHIRQTLKLLIQPFKFQSRLALVVVKLLQITMIVILLPAAQQYVFPGIKLGIKDRQGMMGLIYRRMNPGCYMMLVIHVMSVDIGRI